MSNLLPFTAGLGGGLALWRLMQNAPAKAVADSSPRPATRNCAVVIDRAGLTVDADRVDVAEAVRRCQAAGHADVTVALDAPAATYGALMSALGSAGVPMYRNGRGDTRTDFTLITSPRGHKALSTSRWFRAEAPITWVDARDRLIAAGIIDPELAGRTYAPGGWMLSIDPAQFSADRAEPLPGHRNQNTSSTFTLVTYPQGLGGDSKVMRWFRADPATTWEVARDRLALAGVLDPRAIAPGNAGYWKLVTDPRVFMPSRAKPLPDARRPRGAARVGRYALDGGRTIVRDGEALVRLERVDLGNERYALSPYQTDQLAQRVVRLLNKRGAR